MTINLIDARRGLHNKCLELFADKKIAEQIYRYLCDGIEDCEEAEPTKHGYWIHDGHHIRCSNCEVYFCDKDREGDTLPTNYCPNCGALMDLGEVENDKSGSDKVA